MRADRHRQRPGRGGGGGIEATYQTRDTADGGGAAGVNLGMIHTLTQHVSLLLAGGPSFSGGRTSYHSYVALALNY